MSTVSIDERGRRRARRAVRWAGAGIALLLAACSSSGSRTDTGSRNAGSERAQGGTGIPCSLATQREVSSALGTPVLAGQVANTGDDSLVLCDFDLKGTAGLVSVGIKTGVAKENLAGESGVGSGSKPVEGVGEAAVQACGDSNVRYCTLAAYSAGHVIFVQVSMDGGQDDALLATARMLTLAAIPRL
jgi:hypothetical protein